MDRLVGVILLVSGCLLTHPLLADSSTLPGVENANRAKVNYMLNCQGCHGPDGAGTADGSVPTMKNFLGNFLAVEGGREFLIRVPGSANAALTDGNLAEVLNWMLPRISPDPTVDKLFVKWES